MQPSFASLIIASVLVSGAALLAAPAHAQIYRWVDDAGREHFTQSIDDVPADQRNAAQDRWRDGARRIQRSEAPPPSRLGPSEPASAWGTAKTRPTEAESESAAPTKGPGGRSEAEWRAHHRARLNAIDRLRKSIARIEAGSAAPASVDYSRRARRDKSRARWERNKALRDAQREKAKALAAERTKLAREEERLATFREEARRAGVPPGWLREP